MNKKQILILSILLSLMVVLGITQSFFKETFTEVALVENGINEFKDYNFDEGRYIFSLPSEWSVSEKESQGQYISYKADFKDKDNKITGYLEVINTQIDLGNFAESDLKNLPLSYKNEQIMPFKLEDTCGVLSQYKTKVRKGYTFENSCYYLSSDDGKIIKVLFNVKEDDYKENVKTVFNTIISKINIQS
ncbi:hypothetical protein FDB55_09630 [Clostridium botulinum]|uniref:PsbP C-terminal domain-containing protein n=1 Tax=Clostridium botulinum TaxID=1491 RepID=A0A0C2SKA9_CLOBO|nr:MULTISPECIES: hypothetical protein [Clostridium]ACD53262.1 putative exported protein [Clostridium botulinum E3 str. Alaska E43]AJF28227.1 hypothetical protein ST13_00490 [Clostridium botulinum]AJF31287.1 hypothetical protein ST12_00490 [Clostridium botulinum]KAI3349612.1 hypothetical protein CIT18_07435 [Clostridium botulinum]KIL08438.1 hypothetical protein SR42_05365 [Clostridium botulinum]